jgi:hypothetical protein
MTFRGDCDRLRRDPLTSPRPMLHKVLRAGADRCVGVDNAYQAGNAARRTALCHSWVSTAIEFGSGGRRSIASFRSQALLPNTRSAGFTGIHLQSPDLNTMVAAIPAQTAAQPRLCALQWAPRRSGRGPDRRVWPEVIRPRPWRDLASSEHKCTCRAPQPSSPETRPAGVEGRSAPLCLSRPAQARPGKIKDCVPKWNCLCEGSRCRGVKAGRVRPRTARPRAVGLYRASGATEPPAGKRPCASRPLAG